MLARTYRLIMLPRDRKSTYSKTSSFTLRSQRNSLEHSRIGIVVSKKVDKRATVRNRLKRTFRANLEEKKIHLLKGFDFLFIFHPQIKDHVADAQKEALQSIEKLTA